MNGAQRPIACMRCRKRQSYCSKDLPQCSRCREGNLECIYAIARRVTVTEPYLRGLQGQIRLLKRKVAEYERQSAAIESRVDAPGGLRRVPQADEDEIDAEALLEIGMGQLDLERPDGFAVFRGAAAADNLLLQMVPFAGIQAEDGGLNTDTHFYDSQMLPSRRLEMGCYATLPPYHIAQQYFAAQYEYIGTIFSFCDAPGFDELFRQGIANGSKVLDCEAGLATAKLLVLLAFGQLYSVNQWIGCNGPPGFDFFWTAIHYLPDIHDKGSLLFVETFALIGYFMQNLNRRDAALLYVGVASRMAISLGLHQEVPAAKHGVDEVARERRRRVWWSIYSLDRILSAKSGSPLSITDSDIGASLPSRLPSEPEYCPAVVLRHYTVLSQILGDITGSIYRRPRNPEARLLVNDVQRIMNSLEEWHKELPDQLRFVSSSTSMSRECVSTMLHYYMCLNMTARPLFFHVVQTRLAGGNFGADGGGNNGGIAVDWKEGLSKTTVGVIETCIDGAKDTINIMSMAIQRNLVATYGYMDSEHAFAAAIVLVMVCIAFPKHESHTMSMNTALDLLRAMAVRGNSHVAARLKLLERLRDVAMARGDEGNAPLVDTGDEPEDALLWEHVLANPDIDMDTGLAMWAEAAGIGNREQ